MPCTRLVNRQQLAETSVPPITVTTTEGGAPSPDDNGASANDISSSIFGSTPTRRVVRISHIHQSLLAKQITNGSSSRPKRMVKPADGFAHGLSRRDRLFELGAPKGTRTPVFAVRGRRPRPLDDGSHGGRNTRSPSYIAGDKSGKSATSRTDSRHRRLALTSY